MESQRRQYVYRTRMLRPDGPGSTALGIKRNCLHVQRTMFASAKLFSVVARPRHSVSGLRGLRSCHPPTARPGNLKGHYPGRSTRTTQRRQKEGPDHYRGTSQNHAHHHGPGQMHGTKVLSPRGVRVLLFLLFSLLSMGQIVFVAHIVSLFLAPL